MTLIIFYTLSQRDAIVFPVVFCIVQPEIYTNLNPSEIMHLI